LAKPRENLKDRIYKRIKEDILLGKIKEDDSLLETDISNKFKVSRTPVREAFGKLEQEGLLTWVPRKGHQVKPVSYDDLLEIFSIRIFLEKGAASIGAKTISEEELEKMEYYNIYKDEKAIFDFNKQFHLSIVRAARNKRLLKITEGLIDDSRRILMFDPYMQEKETLGIGEHARIIEALRSRDPLEAEKAVEEHLIATRRRIHESLLK